MTETGKQTPTDQPRRRWDGYRHISAWAGLLEAVAVINIVFTLGRNFTGDGQDPGTTLATVFTLGAPAVLAGLVSGSRYFALYAGYARRLDPTAELSENDAASGSAAGSSFIGDAIWGSLIAGIAGGIVATIALSTILSPVAVIALPLFVLIIGIAWFAGWVVGGVSSMLISAAIGIAVGARERRDGKLLWIIVAAFLVALPVAVAIPIIGTRFSDDQRNSWAAIVAVAGIPVEGFEFSLGDPVMWLARVAIWGAALLFAILIIVGTPAFLERRSRSDAAKSTTS